MNFLFLCSAGPGIPKANLLSEMHEALTKNKFQGAALRNSKSVILG